MANRIVKEHAENQRAVTVNVGLLKAALSEIEVHARVNAELQPNVPGVR